MIFFLLAISVFLGIAGANYVHIIMHIRGYSRTIAKEGGAYRVRWGANNTLNTIFLFLFLSLLPASVIMPNLSLQILIAAIIIALLSMIRWQFVNMAMDEIYVYRQRFLQSIEERKTTNIISDRYVKLDLHTIFHKQSLEELEEGDNVQIRAKILSIDFHNYVLAEYKSDPDDRFRVMSTCIHEAGIILASHNCIITQSNGRGITAIFSNESLNAVEAALAINKRIYSLTQSTQSADDVGIPINYILMQGRATIGIHSIGNMLQPVIASDILDFMQQIQILSRQLHIPMIIDEFSRRTYEKLERYAFRYVGMVENKIDGQSVRTHEIINAHTPDRQKKIIDNREEFEQARRAQETGEMNKAYSQYTNILSKDPQDSLVPYFQQQCSVFLARKRDM